MQRALLTPVLLLGFVGSADAYDINEWPTSFTTSSGVEYGAKGLYQYDSHAFSDDRLADGSTRFDDVETWRRKEFNLYVRKKGVFEINLGYDFQPDTWLDNYIKVFMGDAGEFRFGQFKTPVGMEDGATSSSATTFLERGLPESAIHQGRRVGVDWTYTARTNWLFNLAAFDGNDLNGENEGTTLAGRAVFTPLLSDTEVLHLGLSASRERRDDRIARIRARPEAGLTDVRLIDTGNLSDAEAIDRYGLEAAWRRGPWSVQAEYLGAIVRRDADLPDFHGAGGYVNGSWVLTGEARPYRNGGFGNPVPARPWGALELALRWSTLDLDDGAVAGGSQHDWTLDANWYLTQHFKFQVNYIRVDSDRAGVSLDPDILEARAQVSF